jgi:hypothetical protein
LLICEDEVRMVKKIERLFNDFIYTDDEKTIKLRREDYIKQMFITSVDKKIDYTQKKLAILPGFLSKNKKQSKIV